MSLITEEQVELQSIEWFKELGYQYKDGYEIAPEGVNSERDDYRQVILEERLKSALIRINPDIPNQTIQNSIPEILNPNIPGLLNCNREMHKWITKGLKVPLSSYPKSSIWLSSGIDEFPSVLKIS